MPGQFLTIAERERLSKFPQEISKEDVITFFTLTGEDLNQIPTTSADYNRLGFALQLSALRFLGFCPDELMTTPSEVVTYVAKQLKIDSPSLDAYGQREHTRTDHLQQIRQYLGFRKASEADLTTLLEWLLQRALEHDKPTLLFQMATDWLYKQKIVRPGVTILERMVIQARQQAQEETYRQLNFLISDERKSLLDKLLITEETLGRTPLFWLRYGAVANTPTAILQTISKLEFLFSYGVSEWDLSSLNPNRQKFLAQIGRKSTNQALQRMNEQRRYPILLSFLRQSQASDLSYDQLAWTTNWYIREETLQEAINTFVNFQYNQALSHVWGGGTMSSSDGQRFPVSVKARNAVALPRYFGYGRGITFYSWTSDQFSQYGSKVIPSTIRDATYVLDAILDNETELDIIEHTTDTAGYTELVFALFDLLGMQFSPRIRDIGDQKIYRIDKTISYKHLNSILKRIIKPENVLSRWDDILRVVASIKLGWVTASLFISKLKSYPQQNVLTKVIQEYGRLIKSIYIPSYICEPKLQRRVSTQLNKGESIHDLRRFLFFANEGKIKKSQLEDQANQASALTLVTNAVIIWNTRYIQAIIEQLEKEGYTFDSNDLLHISPCRFDHINKYGKYFFNVDRELNRKQLRPLRQ